MEQKVETIPRALLSADMHGFLPVRISQQNSVTATADGQPPTVAPSPQITVGFAPGVEHATGRTRAL